MVCRFWIVPLLLIIIFIALSGLFVEVSRGEAPKDKNVAASNVIPQRRVAIESDLTADSGGKETLGQTLTFSSQVLIADMLINLQVKSDTGPFISTPIQLSEAWLSKNLWGFNVTAGRKFIRWGPGRYGALLVSDNSPAFDLLRIEGNLGPIRFDEFTALVDSSKSKYFFGHRLEVEPFDGLRLGIGETALASGNFSRWLFNPLPFWPYYLTQHLANKVHGGHNRLVNVGVALDAKYTSPGGYQVYGEYLVDDEPQYRGDNVPDRTGYLIGFEIPQEVWHKKVSLGGEYTRINYYTYSHLQRETDYLHDGEVIGHWLGPDADDLQLETRYHLDPRRTIRLTLERQRHGEGRVGMPWDPQTGKDKIFLLGVVETTDRITLGFDYQYSPGLLFSTGASLGQVQNQGNVSGQSGMERNLWLRFKWQFDYGR